MATQKHEVARLTNDLNWSREQLEKALSEHAPPYVWTTHESRCEFLRNVEEEKELAIAEARLDIVEEFKGGPAFENLLLEKSEWALMELADTILGEFKK